VVVMWCGGDVVLCGMVGVMLWWYVSGEMIYDVVRVVRVL
jgi:hypothetical protein